MESLPKLIEFISARLPGRPFQIRYVLQDFSHLWILDVLKSYIWTQYANHDELSSLTTFLKLELSSTVNSYILDVGKI